MLADVRLETTAEPALAAPAMVRGRSLWRDAGSRFERNKAALTSAIVLVLIVAFTFVGPFLAAWSNEKIDWSIIGMVAQKGQPSLATGHFFGADEVGRDLFSRV